jgi:hypothetical protein
MLVRTLFRPRHVPVTEILVCCLLLIASLADAATFSGRAFGARVVLVNPQPNVLVFSDTGNLPTAGGSLSASLVSISVGGTLSSGTVTASTSGSGSLATSSARVQSVLAFPGQPAQLSADVVQADTRADCAGASGSSTIAGLVFAGNPVVVTGSPNQTITLGALATLVINEQITVAGAADITVNALHLTLGTGESVIISSAHSDINCTVPTRQTTWGRVKSIYR